MISFGERSMPPSIGLKTSAVICGKSAVLFPAALASSIGSFFLQLANTSRAQIPRQSPTRLRRKKWPLAGSIAFTESALIRRSWMVWQENFQRNKKRRLAADKFFRVGRRRCCHPVRTPTRREQIKRRTRRRTKGTKL